MNDDQIGRELRRRADSVSLDSEWAQRDLLLTVTSGTSSRPSPEHASRLPAVARLGAVAAAAVAVIAVLVVASPRLGLGPSGSDSTSPTVMFPDEFASRLSTGELNGRTVLVGGKIVPYRGPLLYGETCHGGERNETPVADCTLGEIDGALRLAPSRQMVPIYVGASYVRVALDSWRAPGPPVEGVLVLEVDARNNVHFLGRVDAAMDALFATVDAVRDVSPVPPTPFDVHILEAWLYEGSWISCPPVLAPRAGLPGRICDPSWLIASPSDDPNRGLRVQSRAVAEIDGTDSPPLGEEIRKQGTYVVASRLEADRSCPTVEPCWQWEVIATITQPSEFDGEVAPTLPPTLSGPTKRPTPQPDATNFECSGSTGETTLVDHTGLVLGCSDLGVDRHAVTNRISNPNGDMTRLHFDWGTSFCVERGGAALQLTQEGDRYTILIREIWGSELIDCALPGARGFELTLNHEVAASMFEVDVVRVEPSPTPGPSTPSELKAITCPYSSIEGRPAELTITDHSGLVVDCEAFVELSTPDAHVEVPDNAADPSVLEVRWEIPEVCTSMPVELELWGPMVYEVPFAPGPEFVLRLNELSPLPGPQGCRAAVSTQGVRIGLASPISADRATLEVFRTKEGVGHDVDSLDDHSLALTLTSTKAQYTAGEPIDIDASILYSGPRQTITMTGLSGQPGFGFHQLDGNVQQSLASSDWTCQDLELRRDVPSTFPFRKGGVFISENFPDPDADAAYWSDPELRLPPGVYRVFANAGGVIDGFCMGGDGDDPGLSVRASIVIEVASH